MSASSTGEETTIFGRLRRFFFAEEVPYGLAIVRIVMPMALSIDIVRRWAHVREHLSADGATAPLSVTFGWGRILPELPGSAAVALFTMLLFSMVTLSIGWRTRLSAGIACALYTYFTLLDSLSFLTKYTVIGSHVLLLLAVSECGLVWSVDARIAKRRRRTSGDPLVGPPTTAVWPTRLVQLLIGYTYFGAAITKMHTPAFFSGDQLMFWVNTHVNHWHGLGEYFTLIPWAFSVFAYVVIVWEILFLFLGWRGLGRTIMLTLGVVFHLGTTVLLGLYIFPLVCISTYFAFATADDVRWAAVRLRRLREKYFGETARTRRIRARAPRQDWLDRIPAAVRFPSQVAFVLVAGATAVLAVQAEHLLDPYGLRRAEGPHALKPIGIERARELLLTSNGPIKIEDQVFAFDMGTTTIGGVLVDRRESFRQGECVWAQATFNPPHGDLWVQCDLHDLLRDPDGSLIEEFEYVRDDQDNYVQDENGEYIVDESTRKLKLGSIIDELGQVVTRDMMRTNFGYTLGQSLEPGLYALVLKTKGREIGRRVFTVTPAVGRALAN